MMRILVLVLMSLMATTAVARSPWYVGGGVGATRYDVNVDFPDDVNLDLDSWEGGFQLFGGYQLGPQWAIEAGYIDFGETKDFDFDAQVIGIGSFYESTGIYVNGQYHIPIAKTLSLDLSGGWIFAEADAGEVFPPNTSGNPQTDSYDDNGIMLGLAFTWQANEALYIRGVTNYFVLDYGDVDYNTNSSNTLKNPWRLGVDLIWNF